MPARRQEFPAMAVDHRLNGLQTGRQLMSRFSHRPSPVIIIVVLSRREK
jgi:hypothetical protein